MKDYKTRCDECYQGTWYETEQPCKRTISHGCGECGSHENISESQKCTGTLRVIDTSQLDDRFSKYYESGQRIEVTYKWGDTERFYVGKSTGIKPIWLAIKKSNSMGGSGIFADSIVSITPLNKYI